MTPRQPTDMGLLEQLRPLRKRSGLTQEQLAKLAGLDRTTISKVEKGATGLTVDTAERIFGLLDAELIAVQRGSAVPDAPRDRALLQEIADVLPHMPLPLVEDLRDRVRTWRERYGRGGPT